MTYRPMMLRNLAEITIPVLLFNGHVLFAGIAKTGRENLLAKYDSISPGSDRIGVAHPASQKDHRSTQFIAILNNQYNAPTALKYDRLQRERYMQVWWCYLN